MISVNFFHLLMYFLKLLEGDIFRRNIGLTGARARDNRDEILNGICDNKKFSIYCFLLDQKVIKKSSLCLQVGQ